MAVLAGVSSAAPANALHTPPPPTITRADRVAPHTIDLAWLGVQGHWAIVNQNGYSTVWPNTGHLVILAAPVPDVIQVCYPGPVRNVCSASVTVGG